MAEKQIPMGKHSVRKILAALTAVLLGGIYAEAQVISFDISQYEKTLNTRLVLHVAESGSNNPLGYATVYLVPAGDTTIVHFTLTDEQGKAEIKKVVQGKYVVNVESIGYKPFSKVYEIKGYEKDLGLISLEENPEYIDAATITALADPMTVKGDTLEYNAAAFRVGTNDMLEDLLKKMPGMEVAEDGSVTVGGEKIDKITVGGKTFFFNDPKMAVKNLPAKIVDKIKVINKDKDAAAFSGVATSEDKEKVMDVVLKEEYKQGWFGNMKAAGGGSPVSREKRLESGQPAVLFDASAMVSRYSEDEQLVMLASGKNVDGNSMVLISYDTMESGGMSGKRGINTAAQAGVNYNTDKSKAVEASLSASYNYGRVDAREKKNRHTWLKDDGKLENGSLFEGVSNTHNAVINFEIENKNRKKFRFDLDGGFKYSRSSENMHENSFTLGESGIPEETASGMDTLNRGRSSQNILSDVFQTRGAFAAGVKDLAKEGRSLSIGGNVMWRKIASGMDEISLTTVSGSELLKNLSHDKDRDYVNLDAQMDYVEPFGKYWKILVRARLRFVSDSNDDRAFNNILMAEDDYYSSVSRNRDLCISERFVVQYKKDIYNLQFGAMAEQERNETYARAFSLESRSGVDEWLYNWSPYLNLRFSPGNQRVNIDYNGRSMTPSGLKISPVLDLTNPLYIRTGNIYLKPEYSNNFSINLRGNSKDNRFNYSIYGYGGLGLRGIVEASWFDTDGIRYSVPVNSDSPSLTGRVYVDWGVILDRKRRFTLDISMNGRLGRSVSYQSISRNSPLDRDAFDYTGFMEEFWGDASGNRFYGGESGFGRSITGSGSYGSTLSLRFRNDNFDVAAGASFSNSISHYSLDSKANTNYWYYMAGVNAKWENESGWSVASDIAYTGYAGYYDNTPQVIWNASLSKSIKAVTLSIKAVDLLNQTRRISRSANADYVEETWRNAIGRYIVFGISFNFGKMNAKQNNAVRNAIWNMVL